MLKIDEITSGKATKFGTDVKVTPSITNDKFTNILFNH
jgi:hypothetical protein